MRLVLLHQKQSTVNNPRKNQASTLKTHDSPKMGKVQSRGLSGARLIAASPNNFA